MVAAQLAMGWMAVVRLLERLVAFGVMSAKLSAIVTSSAYAVMMEAGVGQSCRKKLKIVGDNTAPWGTPE